MLKKIVILISFFNVTTSCTSDNNFTMDSGQEIAQFSVQKEIDAATTELSKIICNATSQATEEPTKTLEKTEKQLRNAVYSTIFCSILFGAWLFEQIRSSLHKHCNHDQFLEKF